MRPLTIFLSRLLGLFIFAVSSAMALNRQSFAETMEALMADRPLLLIIGMALLVAGLAMTLSHNVWSGGALPVIVTLIGWIILDPRISSLAAPSRGGGSLFKCVSVRAIFLCLCGDFVRSRSLSHLHGLLGIAPLEHDPEESRRARSSTRLLPALRLMLISSP